VDSLLEVPDETDLFPSPSASVPQDLIALREQAAGKSAEEKKSIQARMRKVDQEMMSELRAWWLNRMRWSPFPAREKAVLFWHGHWATSVEKVKSPFAMWQQNEALRAHALGGFEPMAQEISRDPAMMRYLDLAQSKPGQPNENFARELMELFTLGEGHYSEEDIRESARAFTGYRINPANQQFVFAQRLHDGGSKTFFGFEGNFTGRDIIGFLAADPQCARFLCRKLWVFYASENPSPQLVEALAEAYRENHMDTRLLLREIFRSREFYAPDVVRKQIKGPVQWLVQACKELEIPLPADSSGILRQLGQMPFAPPNVKGWDGGRSWISSATLLMRYNISGRIVAGRDPDAILPPAADPGAACEAIGGRLFQFSMSPALQKSFLSYLHEHPPGKSVRRDLIHLMMSTPDYQLT
jgi:uncharacterized protein (DUF1800 family)